MTDLTDQDRRAARQWADEMSGHPILNENARAAVRYVLANVDAPEPTLAEELARIAENSPVWTIQNVCDELKSAAARAEQMEQGLTEARAEVERLRHNIDEAYKTRDARDDEVYSLRADVARLTSERDRVQAQVQGLARRDGAHNSEVRMLTEELDEARDEVERLTAELETETVALEVNVAPDQQANTQGILAGSLPDPADVKPGEAWIVEVNGKRGTVMKDGDSLMPWGVVTDGTFSSRDAGEITLVSRLVPAPRVITNPDELDRAKRLTVIRDGVGVVCERAPLGDGWFAPGVMIDQTPYIQFPATVLWEPEA